MYNVIIVSSNDEAKELINHCISKIENIKIGGIANNIEELNFFLDNAQFDYLIFYKYYIIPKKIKNYHNIFIGNYDKSSEMIRKGHLISTQKNFIEIKKEIKNFIQNTSSTKIEQKATEILLDLGFSQKLCGTKYIINAICFSYVHKYDDAYENFKKEVYPCIATLNNTTLKKIEWNITRCVSLTYKSLSKENKLKVEEFFYLEPNQKPTPKQIINTIANRLLYEQESEAIWIKK